MSGHHLISQYNTIQQEKQAKRVPHDHGQSFGSWPWQKQFSNKNRLYSFKITRKAFFFFNLFIFLPASTPWQVASLEVYPVEEVANGDSRPIRPKSGQQWNTQLEEAYILGSPFPHTSTTKSFANPSPICDFASHTFGCMSSRLSRQLQTVKSTADSRRPLPTCMVLFLQLPNWTYDVHIP